MNFTDQRLIKRIVLSRHSFLLILILIAVAASLTAIDTAHARPDRTPTVLTIPSTVKPLGPPEMFDPDTLYEKINGQATLYLSAGFVQLKSQWFAETKDDDAMFEVYIYDMGNGLNAFSVFSVQRRDNAKKSDVARFAYQTENALHMTHGPYYVEMISAAPTKNMLPMMTSLARNFIKDTPVASATIDVASIFPEEHMDPNSISLIKKNVFGFEGLDNVFTAMYNLDGDHVTVFVSKRKTPQEAVDLVRGLYQYFIDYGGREVDTDVSFQNKKMVEIMDNFYMMFSLNAYFAGVHEASNQKQAEGLAERLAITLRKVTEGKK